MDNFNAQTEIRRIVEWIQDWFEHNGPKANAIIGISGGKDSTIVAFLLVKALGKDRVVGVLMPNGKQADINDSKRVVDLLGIKSYTVNINSLFNGLINELRLIQDEKGNRFEVSADTTINIPPRLRMTALYAIAQSIPNGGRVINTCNKSEDYVGYSTKFGDSAGDMSPCMDYTVTEVLAIGDELGLPKDLVHKTPSDGLCGKSDEDNLGFTYAMLDKYILTGECEDVEIKALIDRKHNLNLHKLLPMPHCTH